MHSNDSHQSMVHSRDDVKALLKKLSRPSKRTKISGGVCSGISSVNTARVYVLWHSPGAVRPARPRRCSAEAFDVHVTIKRVMPVTGSRTRRLHRPVSTTYLQHNNVSLRINAHSNVPNIWYCQTRLRHICRDNNQSRVWWWCFEDAFLFIKRHQ
jgi:hypothetical protein